MELSVIILNFFTLYHAMEEVSDPEKSYITTSGHKIGWCPFTEKLHISRQMWLLIRSNKSSEILLH